MNDSFYNPFWRNQDRLIKQTEDFIEKVKRALAEETLVKRPHFGLSQAISTEDLQIGMICLRHYKLGVDKVIILSTATRFKDGDGSYLLIAPWPLKDDIYIDQKPLSDMNLEPYQNGRWNDNNWLETTSEIAPQSEVDRALSDGYCWSDF